MKNLTADVNELEGAAVRLPPSRPQCNLGRATPKRKAVKPTEELR